MDSFKDWKKKYVDKDADGMTKATQRAKARQDMDAAKTDDEKEFNKRKYDALTNKD